MLTEASVDKIYQEKITGISTKRPVLAELLTQLRAGDTVTVAQLSRLDRSTNHLLQLVADFTEREVRFVSLGLSIDTATLTGRLVLTIFAALAEYERESNRERATAGIALAKAQSKHLGRRPGVDEKKLAKVKACLAAGMSVHQVVAATGVSETSVKRYRWQLAA